ncbi:RluA family pseudouridine synthase [Streptococcus parasuis]|uniref:RluA family pseudouridine synthase n=1 Tax=Streptococcus parasuis TaxID=1501662 RepID=UPI001C1FDA81|nr:RluA family pseudouridine synthase [Streptococcus parasuis]QWV86686.1 RluA family pseudouridine synthase [Streptococcus parasuis]
MEIKVETGGVRLDKALSELTELSRSVANDQIKAGQVLVNGQVKKAKYTVQEGDIITYQVPEIEEIDYVAEDIPLDIVYQDEDVAVINKPQGMVVHPSAGHTSGTLVNALLYHVKDLSGINGVLRPGIVHRIDKDTSGLLMIAKNDEAHTKLAAELKDKKSLRKYWAIVHGNLPNDRGVIEAPIGRSEKDRKKQAVTAKGKKAVTRFQVLERFDDYTLVELTLETGRTHQIRVHMAYIGHPVAGDKVYGPRKTLKGNGQFLHARTLGFTHPRTGEVVAFTAEAPAIFQDTLEYLRRTAKGQGAREQTIL